MPRITVFAEYTPTYSFTSSAKSVSGLEIMNLLTPAIGKISVHLSKIFYKRKNK